MPSTHRVPICQNFNAKPGDGVQWINVPPSGCTINKDGDHPWPFNLGPPIPLPAVATVMIEKGLKPGEYYFSPTCCAKPICVTVT